MKTAVSLFPEHQTDEHTKVVLFLVSQNRTGPTGNAFIESFNDSFKDECLNVNRFLSLEVAEQLFILQFGHQLNRPQSIPKSVRMPVKY